MTETIRESFLFENPRSGDGIGSWFKDKVADICRNQIEQKKSKTGSENRTNVTSRTLFINF